MAEVSPAYLEDASGFRGHAEKVFAPSGTEELGRILRQALETRSPITIAGAGTGVTGGRVPQGGWVVSLEKFRRLEIRPGVAIAGAGVPLKDLHEAAGRSGQFYAPDPTETTASVGGTIANNASGSRSFRYGDTRRHVLGLRAVFIDGAERAFRRGEPVGFEVPSLPLPRTTKHSAGYRLSAGMDWVDLLIGSEGTLGIVTEAELRLLPRPAALLAGVVFFPDDESATAAVDAWRDCQGLRMLEYFDRGSLGLLGGRFPDVPASAGAAVLFEQELGAAHEEEIDAWQLRLETARADIDRSWFAASDPDRERFRVFRHALPELVNDTVRRNGFLKLGSDYAVPIDRNREMLAIYRRALERLFAGRYVIFGHIGDAHVHVNILPRSQEDFDRGRELMVEFARAAVALGGTVGAEHGLGKRKAGLLEIQYSAEQIDAMKAVKRRLDPHWLLGRGNLFPFV